MSALTLLVIATVAERRMLAAGPAPVDLRSTAPFAILSGAGITSTGGGTINGNVGASPIAGSAIGVTCAQVNGTIYAVDASGPPCAVIDATLLTTAKGDLTIAYNDAAGRTPTPTGPNLNPGLIPGSGNIGGMNLAPGLYKFTTTALITGSDVTLTGGPDDVWIFQCAQDLQLGSGIKVILAGGALAKNVFWQVGTSAVLGTFSDFKGTILADQSVTINTSSTIEGRALAFSAGVVFNGNGASVPVTPPPAGPEIEVTQPAGVQIADGGSKDFGSVTVGSSGSLVFNIGNSGNANLTGLAITIDGADASMFTLTASPTSPVGGDGGNTTFTIRFAPTSTGTKTATLHIASNDADENPFDITISGTGAGGGGGSPEIAVEEPAGTGIADAGTKDFGSVLTGGSASRIFTIRNTGTANLTGLGITIDGADAASFVVTGNPTAPVTPGGNTTFTVRFAPTTIGTKTATLRIANNDTDENPFDITLTGVGTSTGGGSPEIEVTQPAGVQIADGGSKDFGSVAVGSSGSLVFNIRNGGNANLTGLAITIDGADASMFTLTASPTSPVGGDGGNTTFTIRFAPTSTGTKTAALHIANNDANENPFDITISGTGAGGGGGGSPEIAVEEPTGTGIADAGTKDFGSVLTGGNASRTFTIRNTGTANLTGLGITIDGADAASFVVDGNPTASVTPGGNTTFTVRFIPTTTGTKTATLHIANNDTDENPFDITFTGLGDSSIFVASFSPITLNWQTGLFEQTVRLTNAGAGSVNAARLLIN
ncbi:MAG: choice-of-anchor D domain-containing protein, partial [Limisphaerales bacterium]